MYRTCSRVVPPPPCPIPSSQQWSRGLPLLDPIPILTNNITTQQTESNLSTSSPTFKDKSVQYPNTIPKPKSPIRVLTSDLLLDVIDCPKRFLMTLHRPDMDRPPLSAQDQCLLEDGLQFRHLVQARFTLDSPGTTFRVTSRSFENALEETAEFMKWYFLRYLPTKDISQERPLILQNGAFAAAFDHDSSGVGIGVCTERITCQSDTSSCMNSSHDSSITSSLKRSDPITLRVSSRVGILQFIPVTKRWATQISQASLAPDDHDKCKAYLKNMLYMYTIRHCATKRSADVCGTSFYNAIGEGSVINSDRNQGGSGSSSLPVPQFGSSTSAKDYNGANGDQNLFLLSIKDDRNNVNFSTQNGTLSILKSRMMPLSIDSHHPLTLRSMISSIHGASLRGSFFKIHCPTPLSTRTRLLTSEKLLLNNNSGGKTVLHNTGKCEFSLSDALAVDNVGLTSDDMAIARSVLRHVARRIQVAEEDYKIDEEIIRVQKKRSKESQNNFGTITVSPLSSPLANISPFICQNPNCTKCELCDTTINDGTSLSDTAKAVETIKSLPVFHLPVARMAMKKSLYCQGIASTGDILAAANKIGDDGKLIVKLTPKQQLFVEAVHTDSVLVKPEVINEWFDCIKYPLIALDFESTAFALPPFPHLLPYGILPFQYSAAVYYEDPFFSSTETNKLIQPEFHTFCHMGKNFDPKVDPRGTIGKSLYDMLLSVRAEAKKREPSSSVLSTIDTLKTKNTKEPKNLTSKKMKAEDYLNKYQTRISKDKSKKMEILNSGHGCVVGHNVSFEKRCFQTIGIHSKCKEFRPIFDNLPFMNSLELVSNGIVHPHTKGSNSLKKLVPAFLPHLQQYGGMSIQDGTAALGVYRQWYSDMTRNLPNASIAKLKEMEKQGGIIETVQQQRYKNYIHTDAGDRQRAYNDYIVRKKEMDEKYLQIRRDLITYCNMDVIQMVEVMREVRRVSKLATDENNIRLGLVKRRPDGYVAVPVRLVEATRPVTYTAVPSGEVGEN